MSDAEQAVSRALSRYGTDLDLLADYDRGELPTGPQTPATAAVRPADATAAIEALTARYPANERLGRARGDALDGILTQLEQTFAGEPLYPSAEEKAANLLYMVVKDHPLHDGNKRTAALLFAYCLEANGIDLDATVPGGMLTALVLLVAASDPARKEETIALIRALIAPR